MKVFSAAQAAEEIGCDPRALRRFLRTNDSYRNAGIGGRYTFDEAEVATLGRAFRKAHKVGKSTQRVAPDSEPLDRDPGVDPETLNELRRDPVALAKFREGRRAARAARQQRLRTRMSEVLVERYDDEPVRW